MNIKENLKNAVNVTTITMVGYIGEFPMKRGNCFSVETDDSNEYRIINFNHENLEELERIGTVSFPLKISVLADRIAIICDERIPDEWYSQRFCETCTPRELLPLPQRLKHFLDIERGIREEQEIEINGKKAILVSYKVNGGIRKFNV